MRSRSLLGSAHPYQTSSATICHKALNLEPGYFPVLVLGEREREEAHIHVLSDKPELLLPDVGAKELDDVRVARDAVQQLDLLDELLPSLLVRVVHHLHRDSLRAESSVGFE